MKPDSITFRSLYHDGRHYDAKFQDFLADVPFYYHWILRTGEPVLELGAGTGRITIPLARQGVRLTGLELSANMLELAKEKALAAGVEIEWVRADLCDFRLPQKFRLIFLPFNTIAHLYEEETLKACVTMVRKHLEPEGRFLVDMFNPRLELLLTPDDPHQVVAEYPDPDGNGQVRVTESHSYDPQRRINHLRFHLHFEHGEEVVELLDQRVFFPPELDELFERQGFFLEAKFGNYDLSPFTPSSPRQLFVCRLRP